MKNIDISQECRVAEAKKRKKIENSRTENTLCGSKGLSAKRRLTKIAKKDELEEEQKKVNVLTDNIKVGEGVMKYIKNLKQHRKHSLIQMCLSMLSTGRLMILFLKISSECFCDCGIFQSVEVNCPRLNPSNLKL